MPESTSLNNSSVFEYSVNPNRVADARWDEASKVAIRITTKPCPKCRTPTERSGGCMHMVSHIKLYLLDLLKSDYFLGLHKRRMCI